MLSAWLFTLNRAVVVMRAMVIGKSTEMYADIFAFDFRNAQLHGLKCPSSPLVAPADTLAHNAHSFPLGRDGESSDVVAGSAIASESSQPLSGRQRAAFVALLLDFETAENLGAFEAVSNVFGADPERYYGRVIGCRVHMNGFLQKRCGSDVQHPLLRSILGLRDSPTEGGMAAVEGRLRAIMEKARDEGH